MFPDCEKLRKILDPDSKNRKLFHYSEQLENQFIFNSLHVEMIGDIDIPVKPSIFSEMKHCYKPTDTKVILPTNLRQDGIYVIDATCIRLSFAQDATYQNVFGQSCKKLMEKLFNVDLTNTNMEVQAQLNSLVMCKNTQMYVNQIKNEEKPGSFGCLLLKLPVRGRSRGGSVYINHTDKSNNVKFDFKSSENQTIFAMAGMQQSGAQPSFKIEADPKSKVTFLVFDLVWVDSIKTSESIKPYDFPSFVQAVHETNELLFKWKEESVNLNSAPSSTTTMENSATSDGNQKSCQTISNQPNSVPIDAPLADSDDEDAFDAHFLCFPLVNDYCITELGLSGLKSTDMFVSEVFSSLNYLDIDVAILGRPAEAHQSKVEGATKERYPVLCLPRNSPLNYWGRIVISREQLIRDLTAKVIPETDTDIGNNSEGCTSIKETTKTMHPVLLIALNTTDVLSDIKLSIANLISRLSNVQQHNSSGRLEQVEPYATNLLKKVISIISNTNTKVGGTGCNGGWALLVLLHLTTRLRRVEDGAMVLKLIGERSCLCRTHNVMEAYNYENPYAKVDDADSEENAVNKANRIVSYFVDFILLAGWDVCSSSILNLMDTVLVDDMFALIATELYNAGLTEGAAQICDRILLKMAQCVFRGTSLLVTAVIQLCHRLQSDDSTARYNSLIKALHRISVHTLGPGIMDVDEISASSEMLSKISVDLCASHIKSGRNPKTVFILLKLLGDNGNFDKAYTFWDGILNEVLERPLDKDRNETGDKEVYLERLIRSMANTKDQRDLLKQLAKHRKGSQALDCLVQFYERKQQLCHDIQVDCLHGAKLRRLFVSYVVLVLLAENEEQLRSPRRLQIMIAWVNHFSFNSLFEIATRLQETISQEFTAISFSCKKLYSEILRKLLKSSSAIGDMHRDNFRILYLCFSWHRDHQLIGELIQALAVEVGKTSAEETLFTLDLKFYVIATQCGLCQSWHGKLEFVKAKNNQVKLEHPIIKAFLTSWIQLSARLCSELKTDFTHIYKTYRNAEAIESLGPELPALFSNLLPNVRTKSLFLVVSAIFSSEDKCNMESLGLCFDVFRNVCRELTTRSDLSREFHHGTLVMLGCLLWIQDKVSLENFLTAIRTATSQRCFRNMDIDILLSRDTWVHALNWGIGKAMLSELMDNCISKLEETCNTNESWAIPHAINPSQQQVYQFLLDDWQKEEFLCPTEKGARVLVERVKETHPSCGLCFVVKFSGSLCVCEIIKTRKFKRQDLDTLNERLRVLKEIKNLLFQSSRLELPAVEIADSTIEPLAKRTKPACEKSHI